MPTPKVEQNIVASYNFISFSCAFRRFSSGNAAIIKPNYLVSKI